MSFGPRRSIYADLRIKESFRALKTPRVERPFRMKKMAWSGLTAFYRNRFYEIDRWYKAKIDKPPPYERVKLHTINPDDFTQSLADRLAGMNMRDPEVSEPVDIGLPYSPPRITVEERKARQKSRKTLETLARKRQLRVDMGGVEGDSERGTWPVQLMRLAHHFGLFRDLFHPDAFFHPLTPLRVEYPAPSGDAAPDEQKEILEDGKEEAAESEEVWPVYFGNSLSPSQTSTVPSVSFPADSGYLHTLLMVNPDGNPFEEEGSSVLHWMVANIPGGGVEDGETLCDYLQPLPFKGTGWHRLAFLLFRQDAGKVDLSQFRKESGARLEDRGFSCPDFYKSREDELTPVGVAFFQSEWDPSVREELHRQGYEQPLYAYDWPVPGVPEQEEFPETPKPFNLYLDQYRDAKEVEKEVLTRRLGRTSPFDRRNTRPPQHPNIHWYEDKLKYPSWQHLEIQKQNLALGKYRGLYENKID